MSGSQHPDRICKYPSRLGDPSTMKRVVISAFLAFHIIAITSWCMPIDSPLRAAFTSVVRPYLLWSGLFQSWNMFAPTPKSVNARIEAAVIYKDGHIRNWKFPRMEQLGLVERYYKERYNKYVENLADDKNAALWPDAARHLARSNYKDASNPPQIVILAYYWSDIIPPDNSSHHPQGELGKILYEYDVKPQDLQ